MIGSPSRVAPQGIFLEVAAARGRAVSGVLWVCGRKWRLRDHRGRERRGACQSQRPFYAMVEVHGQAHSAHRGGGGNSWRRNRSPGIGAVALEAVVEARPAASRPTSGSRSDVHRVGRSGRLATPRAGGHRHVSKPPGIGTYLAPGNDEASATTRRYRGPSGGSRPGLWAGISSVLHRHFGEARRVDLGLLSRGCPHGHHRPVRIVPGALMSFAPSRAPIRSRLRYPNLQPRERGRRSVTDCSKLGMLS